MISRANFSKQEVQVGLTGGDGQVATVCKASGNFTVKRPLPGTSEL